MNAGVFVFFLFLFVLQQGIPTVYQTKLMHSLAGQFLYMEAVDYSFGFGKDRKTILHIESEMSRVTFSCFMRSSTSIRLSTCMTPSDFVPETTATRLGGTVTVDDKRIQLVVR